jgi:hypothetical protein
MKAYEMDKICKGCWNFMNNHCYRLEPIWVQSKEFDIGYREFVTLRSKLMKKKNIKECQYNLKKDVEK